jgi:hypothetical protein
LAGSWRGTRFSPAPVYLERGTRFSPAPIHLERGTRCSPAPIHLERGTRCSQYSFMYSVDLYIAVMADRRKPRMPARQQPLAT